MIVCTLTPLRTSCARISRLPTGKNKTMADAFAAPSPSLHLTAAACLAAALLVGCGPSGGGAPGAGGPGGPGGNAPPPPPVGVITAQASTLDIQAELPGRTEASRVAQVRARVTGIVQKRLFQEGSDVKAGQSLFQIDAATYLATLSQARAAQAKAEANLTQARATLERNRPLAEARAISEQDWVATQAAFKQAQADLANAKAAVTTAGINVGYATVKAPISGRIGRALVTEGALVSANEATQMALIQQVDPLYLNVTQSVSDTQRLRRAVEAGRLKQAGGSGAEVQVVLEDGSVHAQPGRLLFSDLSVDPSSGQVTLRVEVPNPKGDLLPGMYVKARVPQAQSDRAYLVPQQAVTRGVSGDTLMVVGDDQQVSPRPVKLAGAQGSNWVVVEGLQGGEKIVVDGFQKIRPKSPVTPVPWSASAPAGAGPAPAAASAPASAAAPATAAAPAASR